MMTLAIVLKIHAGFQVVFPAKAQGCVAFLRFSHITLKSLIEKPYDFEPKTLGEHVKRRRLKMGLMQKEVAKLLGY
jgi:hypothetical protein